MRVFTDASVVCFVGTSNNMAKTKKEEPAASAPASNESEGGNFYNYAVGFSVIRVII